MAQVAAVASDIGVDAVKIGMLGTVETIEAVDRALDLVGDAPVVLDPVMVAESGAVLLDGGARDALRERLLPRATVVTPNLPEARVLADGHVGDDADAFELARAIHALGPRAVVVTGGHREVAADVFFDGDLLEEIAGDRHPDGAAHGSGCTHSSALAASLAHGLEPLAAARVAKQVAGEAVRDGLRSIGAGAGPVDVLGPMRRAGLPAPLRDDGAPSVQARCHNRARREPDGRPTRRVPDQVPAHEARPRRGRPDRGRSAMCARTRSGSSRSSAASSTRACGPPCPPPSRAADAARRRWCATYADIPPDAERVIFFPRAAGG